jgi:predicted nucleic acid-binding protein
MVPTPAIAEYLHGIPADEQTDELAALSESFFIAPFDLRAASIAGEIASRKEYRDRFNLANRPGRNVMRTDLQILSTAIAFGASHIVTANLVDYNLFAGNRIRVMEVPNMEEQGKLF